MTKRPWLLLLPLLLAALPAVAQVFPDRPVRIIVPINPGGGLRSPIKFPIERIAHEIGQVWRQW